MCVRRRRGPIHEGGNWATRCGMPTARPSTIRSRCCLLVGRVSARRRPATGASWHSQQVSQSGYGWRSAADPASETGYKIANPTGAGADPHAEAGRADAAATAMKPFTLEGHDPETMHQQTGGGARHMWTASRAGSERRRREKARTGVRPSGRGGGYEYGCAQSKSLLLMRLGPLSLGIGVTVGRGTTHGARHRGAVSELFGEAGSSAHARYVRCGRTKPRSCYARRVISAPILAGARHGR